MRAPLAVDEAERLAALRRLEILDTPPEEAFDRLVRLTAAMVGTPMAVISLVDESRQWFKARLGLEATETPREIAFCAHAILGDQPLVVEDATRDPRFADNPLVTGEPFIHFYAGAPIRTRDGHPVGVLCAIDRTSRRLPTEQRLALVQLAALAADQLELRCLAKQLASREALLARTGRLARIGGWQLDLASMTTHWSDEVYRIHEVEPGQRYVLDGALDFYPPEARAVIEPALARLMAEGRPYDLELPFVTARGRRLWVRTIGEAEHQGGRIVRLSGTFQDVTERRRTEVALRDSEERLRAAQVAAGLALLDVDLAADLTRWDARLWELLGISADQAITRAGFLAAVHPEDRARMDSAIARALDPGGSGEYRIEYRVRRPDGDGERWLEAISRRAVRGRHPRAPARHGGRHHRAQTRRGRPARDRAAAEALMASGIVGVIVCEGERSSRPTTRSCAWSAMRADLVSGRLISLRMTPPEGAEAAGRRSKKRRRRGSADRSRRNISARTAVGFRCCSARSCSMPLAVAGCASSRTPASANGSTGTTTKPRAPRPGDAIRAHWHLGFGH